MKLLIASAFYEIKAYSPYVESLFQAIKVLTQEKIDCEYLAHPGDSYVDRAKNTICAKFLETNCTDLLIIDSDLSFDAAAVLRVAMAPVEVVAGAYPIKGMDKQFVTDLKGDAEGYLMVDQVTGLLRAEWVAAGFLRLQRSCLEKMQKAYSNLGYIEPNADPQNPDRIYTPFFECIIKDRIRMGEDYTFCQRWKAIGGELWIEPRITFGHYGTNGWFGNFHEHLLEPRKSLRSGGNLKKAKG